MGPTVRYRGGIEWRRDLLIDPNVRGLWYGPILKIKSEVTIVKHTRTRSLVEGFEIKGDTKVVL